MKNENGSLYVFKIGRTAVLLLLALSLVPTAAAADKKIELQDIEEDNLKSEKEKALESETETPQLTGAAASPHSEHSLQLNYLNDNLVRVYSAPTEPLTQPRYVQQYVLPEPEERYSSRQELSPDRSEINSVPVQQMIRYIAPVQSMQYVYVPQYYHSSTQPEQTQSVQQEPVHVQSTPNQQQSSIQYVNKFTLQAYPTVAEVPQHVHANYVKYPNYLAQDARTYIAQTPSYQSYAPHMAYITVSAQPTNVLAPGVGVSQTATYVTQRPNLVNTQVAPTANRYQQQYSVTENQVNTETDDSRENGEKKYESFTNKEAVVNRVSPYDYHHESPKAYTRDEGQIHSSSISELPRPSSLLYQSQPPHLAGVPKVLAYYSRPHIKPVYSHISGNLGHPLSLPQVSHRPVGETGYHHVSSNLVQHVHPQNDLETGFPYFSRNRPSSLLESYIPSNVQLEYLKRGLAKDALGVYDALSSGRFAGAKQPRQYERGFLPNQLYHTAAGGVTYGHYKRAAKTDKNIKG